MKDFRQSKMFHKLPEEMIKKYVSNAQIKTFEKREVAFTPYSNMESMYLVLRGRIRITLNYPNGKEFTISLLDKGDVYSGHARGLGIALEKTEVAFLPLRVFQEMVNEYPSFAINVLATVGSTLQTTFNVIENLVFRDVNERIYAFILTMIDSKGTVTKEGIEVSLGLTQAEIATMVSSTRQTVNSVLTSLQKEQVISFSKKKLIVHDRERLSSLIGMKENK